MLAELSGKTSIVCLFLVFFPSPNFSLVSNNLYATPFFFVDAMLFSFSFLFWNGEFHLMITDSLAERILFESEKFICKKLKNLTNKMSEIKNFNSRWASILY